VRFATIDLVKAGWLVIHRGYWSLTDQGLEALQSFKEPADLYRTAKVLYAQWRRENPIEVNEEDLSPVEEVLSETVAEDTLEDAEADAWDQIYTHISKMDPYDFQDLIGALLSGMGYHVSWKSPPGPDRGLDILAYTDPLGATGPRIKVQVKRRLDKSPAEVVRSFMASLGDHDVGLFICTGGFTANAEAEVRDQQTRRLTLLDAGGLFDLWVQHYSKVPEQYRNLLPLKPIYFLDSQSLED
jgi:restriction system protein